MRIARVVGVAVSTAKVESLRGSKLLVLRPATPSDEPQGEFFVAADAVGAGTGELVLVASGSASRQTEYTDDAPVDAVVMAILDSLEVDGEITFRKQ
ncbi:ethanolamine utilization protein EutN [Arachnia propionica]|uniref:Ethanolamine utilization protein EutN n=1 Tax=Arachnia propionica TaxID=1750 RepID=A0A3P1T658_9ACTN|nr:EutN/CcmL family microcompartment protein [Arachnia propionica]MDO5083839.1 EutN/CcmL family microcompartment protein [Arachnia propionica]RRD04981.1 ethanolamine utilization protein EutN [Arachnia propionica]